MASNGRGGRPGRRASGMSMAFVNLDELRRRSVTQLHDAPEAHGVEHVDDATTVFGLDELRISGMFEDRFKDS